MPVPHIIWRDEHVTQDTIRTTWIMVHCVYTFQVLFQNIKCHNLAEYFLVQSMYGNICSTAAIIM